MDSTGEDSQDEQKYVTVKEATRLFPTGPTVHCVTKWMKVGVQIGMRTRKRGDRQRITLRSVQIGGRLYTTSAWVKEFRLQCDSQ